MVLDDEEQHDEDHIHVHNLHAGDYMDHGGAYDDKVRDDMVRDDMARDDKVRDDEVRDDVVQAIHEEL